MHFRLWHQVNVRKTAGLLRFIEAILEANPGSLGFKLAVPASPAVPWYGLTRSPLGTLRQGVEAGLAVAFREHAVVEDAMMPVSVFVRIGLSPPRRAQSSRLLPRWPSGPPAAILPASA